MKRPEFAALTFIPKWLINAMLPAIILSLACAGMARTQDPLGSPNEIWITSPSGNTFYNGEEVELQIHVANEFYVEFTVFGFRLYSPDTSAWVWVEQSNGLGMHPGGDSLNLITVNEDSRWIAAFGFDLTGLFLLPIPLGSESEDTLIVRGYLVEPLAGMAPGELEHTFSLHIRPTHTGTICIDSAFYLFPSDEWYFCGENRAIIPAFNDPFCFTVVPGKGDINCDGAGNVADAVYLINWIFKSGPEPCR